MLESAKKPIMRTLLLNASPIKAAYSIAQKNHQEIFLVGGVLRDLHLQGAIGEDIDFLIQRDVESIARQFAQIFTGRVFCLDAIRGNYRTIIHDDDDYHTADFAPLLEGQIISDLMKRDFTINSIALRLSDLFEKGALTFIDPTGGMADLQEKRIRICSPRAFEDDPVRLLRAIRFSKQYHFDIEPATEHRMRETKARLLTCSWERIRNEFFMILCQPGASHSLQQLDRLELLSILLPEIDSMKGMKQGAHHACTLFDHALQTVHYMEMILCNPEQFFPLHKDALRCYFSQLVDGVISRKALAFFIALLHDVGKPSTFRTHNGEIHFYGHDRAGMEIGRRITARFKLSHRSSTIISKAIQHHMRPLQIQLLPGVTDRARYRLIRDITPAVLDTLILSLADAMATRPGSSADPHSIALYPLIADLLDFYCSNQTDREEAELLSGYEIMEALNLQPGKQVGRLLEKIREAERIGLISTKEEALQLIADTSMSD